MNIQLPNEKGWQLLRWMGPNVAARTWAKNSGVFTYRAMLIRFWSFQAGNTSRKTPGSGRSPYQPSPQPSAFVGVIEYRALKL